MSTTHFVKSLSDLSIFSRAVPAAPGQLEWVLKILPFKEGKSETEIVIEILSSHFTGILIKYDDVNNGYNITIDNLSASLSGARSYHEVTSKEVSLNFDADVNKHARFVVVDDLSMLLECIFEGPTINDYVIVLNIETTSTPNEYFFRVWCHELNAL